VDLVGTALGYLISVVQVTDDFNHLFGSPAGLDVNPFRMVLPIAPGKSNPVGLAPCPRRPFERSRWRGF